MPTEQKRAAMMLACPQQPAQLSFELSSSFPGDPFDLEAGLENPLPSHLLLPKTYHYFHKRPLLPLAHTLSLTHTHSLAFALLIICNPRQLFLLFPMTQSTTLPYLLKEKTKDKKQCISSSLATISERKDNGEL